MHQERAVAAIADAYQATRSDQRGSNLYIEICLLIIYKRRFRNDKLRRSDGRHDLRFQECSTNLGNSYTHLGKKMRGERRAFKAATYFTAEERQYRASVLRAQVCLWVLK